MNNSKTKCAAGIFALWAILTSGEISTGQPMTSPQPATSFHVQSKWNVRDSVPLADFIIQSHRGAGVLAPENTLGAFELGWKLGTVPESDLRTTSDGVIVAFHDPNFARVIKGASPELQKKGVKDITFAELSKLDVGSRKGNQFEGRHISKMSDVFTLMTGRPERQLYLDIKNVDFKELAAEVNAAHVGAQVILASPRHEVIREWKKLIPDSQTLLWMGGTENQLKKRIADLCAANFAGVTQLQIHIYLNTNSVLPEPFTLSRHFLESTGKEVRAHGIVYQAMPYDTTDPKVDWQLLDLGFDSFATDHPDITLKAVRDYYAQKAD